MTAMFSRVRNYFKEARLVRMSDGSRCLVRDLGPVKGGKGMKHHEVVMALSLRGLINVARPAKTATVTEYPVPADGVGAS
ncbi:MAG: hypothetical protein Q7T73_00305 [Beijerinckiaceae bacterium]|nr:hypothetical protein [Beijerinckiaceae bacterium]